MFWKQTLESKRLLQELSDEAYHPLENKVFVKISPHCHYGVGTKCYWKFCFLIWYLMMLHNCEWIQHPGNSLLHPHIQKTPVSLSPTERSLTWGETSTGFGGTDWAQIPAFSYQIVSSTIKWRFQMPLHPKGGLWGASGQPHLVQLLWGLEIISVTCLAQCLHLICTQ